MSRCTNPKHDHSREDDWATYFRTMRAASQEQVAIPPVTKMILEQRPVEVEDLPPKTALSRLAVKVAKADWPILTMSTSLVSVSDEFRMRDAPKKPGEEVPSARAGELTKAAHEVRYWWIVGAHKVAKVGFEAGFQEGSTPKGGRSLKFIGAHAIDPLGIPSELFYDYIPSANELKQAKDEPGWAHEERVARRIAAAEFQDHHYNLGQSYLNKRPFFPTAAAFNAWLDEAIGITEAINKKKEDS